MQVSSGTTREVLVFLLGREHYAVEIRKVQEIRGYEEPTRIAGAAPHVKGVLNLRGEIVPIVDLRLKLDVGACAYDQHTVTIIMSVNGVLTGLVVDAVSDVVALGAEQVRPPPDFGSALDTRFITGIASAEDRMLILADLDKLLAEQELEALLA